ncbi:MAG: undecaprenyl/decaprenyl-phosphate alpha-N-acetylglucosaminyl 1-phosphate transferase [Flavobacteriales bacterium]|nr:undecaprenyl/decaprenyl-phosphate alpha-N-acetylglucosaminyl 1-phosphate transferase [Flavobacteriales bacterium]
MKITDYSNYLIFFSGSLIISLIVNLLLLKFSQNLGIRNKNDVTVRWSSTSKPSLGGISLFLGFLFSTFMYLILDPKSELFSNMSYVGLFISASLAFMMGLADDAYNTKPLFKLAIQILCGLIFIWTDTKIDLFHIEILDQAFTILWVIILMNSLNMLDNMDGITATTTLFALMACLFSCYFIGNSKEPYWIFTIVSVIGAIVGFLRYNINPSKMFMGDAGSQFIGLFVAFFTVKYLWNLGALTENHSWVSIIITLVALTPAAADTLTVVINRLKAGKSPMVGGKDHTTHHLVYAGFNDRQVWYIFTLIGFLSFAFSAFIIYLVKHKTIMPIFAFLLFFVVVFYYLYRNTILFQRKEN